MNFHLNISHLIVIVHSLTFFGPMAAASDWDVSDTGQPYKDVEFTLTEGTWMSVDVSPDGQQLVFDLLGDIYTMPSKGGEATLVHGGPVMVRTPSYSLDGSKILYLSDESGGDNAWISNPDGTNRQQVTHEKTDVLSNPVWGPGGDYIAATKLSSIYINLHTSELRLFHMEGGIGQPLVAAPGGNRNVGEPEISPDGRYLYYSEKVGAPDDPFSIYLNANYTLHAIMQRDLHTGKTTELLRGFGGATTPRVSPDGSQLAFVRRVKDKTILFTYSFKTGEQRPVYDGLDRDMQGEWIMQGAYYPPFGWFPDNRNIAIWGKGKLFKVDTRESAAKEIPFTVKARHRITDVGRFSGGLADEQVQVKAMRHLAIAPDQRQVVFNALGHLWKMALPEGKPERISNANEFEFEPAFSPDGRYIVYVAWDDEKGSKLQLMTAGGKLVRTLAESKSIIRQPSFSPDNSMIVYHVETGNMCMTGPETGPGTGAGIYTVNVDGGSPAFVRDSAVSPLFSPDGERLYYTVAEYSNYTITTKLQSVDLAGYDQRDHAVLQGSDRTDLQVSPDLKWLAFKDNQEYYVTRLVDKGRPMNVAATGMSVTPVTQLTYSGGSSLTWAANSSGLYWLLGNQLHHAVTGSEAVEPPVAIALEVISDVPEGVLALTGGRVITMAGEPIETGTVVIEANRITAIGSADEIEIPEGAETIDITGKTIMPGLVDMHGHIDDCYYGSTGAIPQKQPSQYAALAYGITTNFDPYTTDVPSLSSSEMRDAGVTVGPRTISVGLVLYGRPGKFDPVYTPINSLADAQNIMQRKAALGVRVVKSYRQPLRSQRQQLMKASRDAGIMIALEGESHFYNNLSGILDGHNTVEHNLPVANYYDDVVRLFAHSGTASTSTLIITFGELLGENYIYQNDPKWEDPRIDSFVPLVNSGYSPTGLQYNAPLYARAMTGMSASDELWDIGFRSVARSVKKLDDAGVLVNVGSHGQVQGLAMHWEMELMSEGGMSNERVLRAATLNGATTLGLDKHIGSLEVGKVADIIVLDSNPLADIRNTNTVRYTIINGRVYDAQSMNETVRRDKPRSKFYWE